jgi:predicted AlkP superfamily pyrophosphatase or phosphodiesterase
MRAILTLLLICCGAGPSLRAEEVARHVVVVVWDGMRPDFVSETNTPALHALAGSGVFFKSNHCVYFSSTEVNGTALATGAYPQRSGIIANSEFRPNVDPRRPIAMERLEAIRTADAQEKYLGVPTLAETLHAHGLHTAIAGSKGVALLHDRADRGDGDPNPVLFDDRTLPAAVMDRLTRALGPLPEVGATKTNRDTWVARALTGPMWEKGVPAFSLLWLAEPDNSQHNSAPGSPRALAVIRNSDHALSIVIEALKEKGVYDATDIFVVSDHGFSTIARVVNVAQRLQEHGFSAAREFAPKPAKGDVLVVGSGGSLLLYVAGHDEKTIERLVNFLQAEDYVGVLFTRSARKGTFALDDAMIHSAHAPDVVFSFRWSEVASSYGIAGQVFADTTATNAPAVPVAPVGTHVSLSSFDLHNTLIAAGPDFRRGFVSETPSGNVDVTPTILHLLGIKPSGPMDGRVLFEALNATGSKPPEIRRRELQAQAKLPSGEWAQRLSITEVNGVRYLEAGRGQLTPSGTSPVP